MPSPFATASKVGFDWYVAAPFFVLLSAALAFYAFWGFTADDAYIVARYSENLAAGHGLVFNSGEYVSALTSPAEALVLAALAAGPLPTLTLYKILCAMAVGGSLSVVSYVAFRDNAERTLFLAVTAASPLVVMWTAGGLETPLLLSVATCLCLLCFRPLTRLSFGLSTLLASVGFIIRFDNVLFSAPIILTMGWQMYRTRTLSAMHILPGLLPIGWLIFSYRYYGDIFPTSLYVKAPHFGLMEVLKGTVYEVSALVISGLWLIAPPISRCKLVGRLDASTLNSQPLLVALWAGFGLVLVYGLSAGTKHMMFGYRLFVPYLPGITLALMRFSFGSEKRVPRQTLAAVAALQVCMTIIVWDFSVNPTLLTPWKLYEYSRAGMRSYTDDFLSALEYNADTIVAHWRVSPSTDQRPLRIATYAGGLVPYLIPDAYVYEGLISYRKHCARRWSEFANYTMILYPRHGDLETQLGSLSVNGQMIGERVVRFDGSLEHFQVWYNPQPKTITLPARISDQCTELGS